jgi:hypothetical protein
MIIRFSNGRNATRTSSAVTGTVLPFRIAEMAVVIGSKLRTGHGGSSHLRALFGDVTFETLVRIGISLTAPATMRSRGHISSLANAPPPETRLWVPGAPSNWHAEAA